MKETMMMFWYGNAINGWGYGLMIISMVAFWGLVIYAVAALLRATGRDQPTVMASAARTPQQLLAERFARGEIDETEFTSRLAALHEHAHVRS